MTDALLIMVAPNGARRSKADHPMLPMTAEEIGETARQCRRAGAAAIHLHVRDGQGRHSLDHGLYREAIAAISATCGRDIVVQVTTEAAGVFGVGEQFQAVKDLVPTAISLSVREVLRDGEKFAAEFLGWLWERSIAVQFIAYDEADIDLLVGLRGRGLLGKERLRILIVVGRYGENENSTVEAFERLYGRLVHHGLHDTSIWMTCAFGTGEMACLEASILRGGHVRVGFENAIADGEGRLARDNAERVERIASIASSHNRTLANAEDAAVLLGLTNLVELRR